jgi:hypothetical protein
MSEEAAAEANETTTTTDTTNPVEGGESSLDLPAALDVIRKLRDENAKRRIEGNESKAELDEFRKWKDSQLSELERAQKAVTEARSEAIESWRHLAAKEYGVPENLVSRIQGDSRESIFADAKTLAPPTGEKSAAQPQPMGLNLFGGIHGSPVASKSDGSADEALRRALRGSR